MAPSLLLAGRRLERELERRVQADRYWRGRIRELFTRSASLHLAILVEPYLSLLLQGKKTVESRFSKTRIAPYGRVHDGDALLLKRTSGPVLGVCEVRQVWSYRLAETVKKDIRTVFDDSLCADDDFWEVRKSACFATLILVGRVIEFEPFSVAKRDRRGWIVLSERKGIAGPR